MKRVNIRVIEISIVFVGLIATFFIAGRYDILEKLVEYSKKYEEFEIDEIITVSLVFMIWLLVFTYRQYVAEINTGRLIKMQNEQLEKALAEVKVLRGFIPICSICKSIRDERGAWQKMEAYVEKRSNAEFSHSICDKCMEENYPPDELESNSE